MKNLAFVAHGKPSVLPPGEVCANARSAGHEGTSGSTVLQPGAFDAFDAFDDSSSMSTQSSLHNDALPDAQMFDAHLDPLEHQDFAPPMVTPPHKLLHTNDRRVEVSLLKLLSDMQAPLCAFQSIMSGAHDAFESGCEFNPSSCAHDSQINSISKWLNTDHLLPIEKVVCLPEVDGSVTDFRVTTFDFTAQLHSLLQDPSINQIGNFTVDSNNPFSFHTPPDNLLGEVHSGSWCESAWNHMVTQTQKNFLIGIILCMDKTVLSQSNKLTLHPVQFSLTIFKQSTRKHPSA